MLIIWLFWHFGQKIGIWAKNWQNAKKSGKMPKNWQNAKIWHHIFLAFWFLAKYPFLAFRTNPFNTFCKCLSFKTIYHSAFAIQFLSIDSVYWTQSMGLQMNFILCSLNTCNTGPVCSSGSGTFEQNLGDHN